MHAVIGWRRLFLLCVVLTAALLVGVCDGQTQQELETTPLMLVRPRDCVSSDKNVIFSVPFLSCLTCPVGQMASEDGYECVCGANGRASYVTLQDAGGPELVCFDCGTLLLSVTQDRRSCIPCGNTTRQDLSASTAVNATSAKANASNSTSGRREVVESFDASRNDLDYGGNRRQSTPTATPTTTSAATQTQSCGCPVGFVLSDFNVSGAVSLDSGKFCAPCPFNSYVDPAKPFFCTPCPDVYMRRNPTSGVCECTGSTVEDSVLIADTLADRPFVGRHECINRVTAVSLNAPTAQFAQQIMYRVVDVDQKVTDQVTVERSAPFMQHFLSSATKYAHPPNIKHKPHCPCIFHCPNL